MIILQYKNKKYELSKKELFEETKNLTFSISGNKKVRSFVIKIIEERSWLVETLMSLDYIQVKIIDRTELNITDMKSNEIYYIKFSAYDFYGLLELIWTDVINSNDIVIQFDSENTEQIDKDTLRVHIDKVVQLDGNIDKMSNLYVKVNKDIFLE